MPLSLVRCSAVWVLGGAAALAAPTAAADTVAARCELQPRAAGQPILELPCQFSQRQGFVSILRADGVRHAFRPLAAAGRYQDETGQPVARVKGLGAQGQVYRLPEQTLSVRWATPTALGTLPAPPEAAPAFERRLQAQGIAFHVQAEAGRLRINPSGLAGDNSPLERSIQGRVLGAELADLNADGSPELYVFLSDTAPGQTGPLVAVAVNARQSLSDIALPPLDSLPGAARGYRGGDQFAVLEGLLGRRFAIHRDGDAEGAPSGGVRQLQYRLQRGEAGWVLRLQRLTEF